jgi:hypothetical protein
MLLATNLDVSSIMKIITNPMAPVPWLPVILIGLIIGLPLGLNYVKSKTPNAYRIFEAKAFKNGIPLFSKPYKYGVAMETNGSGTATTARLHMHNKKDKMYQDPVTKKPRIVNRKNIEYGVTETRIDGVPLITISTIDPVEGTPVEHRAGTMFIEKARQHTDTEDEHGNRIRTFKYPTLASIPSKEANKISDLVYAIDDDELESLSKTYTHVEKNFVVPDTIQVQVTDENGDLVKDEAGNPVMMEQTVTDSEGKPVYRKPNKQEIEKYLTVRAEVMANEARRLREELAMEDVSSGITILDALHSIVTRPWLDEEIDVIDTQNEMSKIDEKKDKKHQDARVDNTVILFIGGAGATARSLPSRASAARAWMACWRSCGGFFRSERHNPRHLRALHSEVAASPRHHRRHIVR